MQTVLIVVHLLIVIALIATVLLQRSEGGALGMGGGGGGGSFFTGRGQANALTRATAILAFLFFCTSLGLTIMASYNRAQKSIFAPAAVTAPANSAKGAVDGGSEQPKGTVLDRLKNLEKNAPPAPPEPTAPEGQQAPPRSE